MQDPTEIFFEVDSEDNPIGGISRSEANNDSSKFHRAINVLVYFEGKVLIAKRPSNKDTFPDCFDLSVTGHVNYPEEYIDAAIRETQEEIGVKVSRERFVELGKILVKMTNENEYQMNYKVELAGDEKDLVEALEASSVYWMSIESVIKSIEKEPSEWTDWSLVALKEVYLVQTE